MKEDHVQLNQHPVSPEKLRLPTGLSELPGEKTQPQKLSNWSNSRLSFRVRPSLAFLRQRTTDGLRRLHNQGSRINQLSAELEAALLELKAIASEVNQDHRALQGIQQHTLGTKTLTSFAPEVCEYQAVNLPNVQQQQSGSLLLTSRPVDLFKAEREAALLAEVLRSQRKRKINRSRKLFFK